jgi:hypothetical protein
MNPSHLVATLLWILCSFHVEAIKRRVYGKGGSVDETITYPVADVSGSSPLTSKCSFRSLFESPPKEEILWMLTSPLKESTNCKIEVQMTKGLWWIPRHPETKKGVASDEMLRGVENKH